MHGTKHPIYGADGRAGLGQSRPTQTQRDAEMSKEDLDVRGQKEYLDGMVAGFFIGGIFGVCIMTFGYLVMS